MKRLLFSLCIFNYHINTPINHKLLFCGLLVKTSTFPYIKLLKSGFKSRKRIVNLPQKTLIHKFNLPSYTFWLQVISICGRDTSLRYLSPLFINLFMYLFIYLFVYSLFKVDLHNKNQLTSTIKTRLDICTCYINIELRTKNVSLNEV